jgi:hypothetical protein
VAEDGILAAGQHRRQPPPFVAQAPVADGVNTAMNTVQAASLDPPSDGGR